MDITFRVYDKYLNDMYSLPKRHWKFRNLKKRVDEHIGGLRIEAYLRRGTFVGFFCSKEATRLEKQLGYILENKNDR